MDITFQQFLENNTDETIDFQITPLGNPPDNDYQFCIFPIYNAKNAQAKTGAIFEIVENTLRFISNISSEKQTFENYLRRSLISWRLRIDTVESEQFSFYIHPINQDRETKIFRIIGNQILDDG